jgi:2Fe-2S ferredoxin
MKRRVLTVGSLLPQERQPAHKSTNTDLSPVPRPDHQDAVEKTQQRVQISQNGNVYMIKPVKVQTVLKSALDQGKALDYKCTKGTCGRCKVQVLDGSSLLSAPNEAEKAKLTSSLAQGYRLSCQAVFTGVRPL